MSYRCDQYIWPFNLFKPIKGTGDHELTDELTKISNGRFYCFDNWATINAIDARIRYRHLPYYIGNIVYFQDTNGKYQRGIDKNYGSR